MLFLQECPRAYTQDAETLCQYVIFRFGDKLNKKEEFLTPNRVTILKYIYIFKEKNK